MKIKRSGQDKSKGIFIKMTLVYALVLLIVLIFVGITIDYFCIQFIKEQRVRYNTQILEKASYEMDAFYSKMNYVLVQLCNEDKFSQTKIDTVVKGESAFSKIKREVDFVESVKNVTYANGIGEFCNGVLFFNDAGESYYIGSGAIDTGFPLLSLKDSSAGSLKAGGMDIIGPMCEEYKKNYSKNKQVVGFLEKSNISAAGITGEFGVDKEQPENQYVMVTIEVDKLVGILKNIFLDDKGFFITDQSGDIIYENGLKEMNVRAEDLKEKNGSVEAGSKKVLVTSVSLHQYGWSLSVADEENVLFGDVERLRNRVIAFIGLGSLISVLLFLLITRKVLFPIKTLKNMLYQVTQDNDTYLEVKSKDEAGQISKMINEMKKRIKKLTENQYLMEIKTTEARLQVLQSQINPHFLYNTLDNIYCIAQIEEIEPISILTKNLSEMLRYSIDTKQMFVSLDEEIQYLQAYLKIINIRYQDRVILEIDVEENMKDCQVFRLLLQPLVENACLHGILPSGEKPGIIRIEARKEMEEAVIEVKNNGVILSDEKLEQINKKVQGERSMVPEEPRKGTGIALENVNERIRLFYGKEYGMTMERVEEWGTCVRIRQKYIPHCHKKG